MTSPVIASRTATLISSDSSALTIGLGSPSAGDLLIVVVSIDGDASSIPVVDAAFSGSKWNRTSAVTSTNAVTALVLWKIAEGSDALRLQLSASEQSSAECIRVTGHGSAVFIASATGNSTNADPPNAAITGSAQDLLVIAAACMDATVVASVAPSSYGNLTTQAGGAGGASVSIADRAISAASSENPGTFTSSTEQWVAFTIIVPENAITTNARETQEAVESVSLPTPNLAATQVAVESVSSFVNNLVATQVAIESVTPQTQNLYATQVSLEALSGDPWPSTGNVNKYRQIQIAC